MRQDTRQTYTKYYYNSGTYYGGSTTSGTYSYAYNKTYYAGSNANYLYKYNKTYYAGSSATSYAYKYDKTYYVGTTANSYGYKYNTYYRGYYYSNADCTFQTTWWTETRSYLGATKYAINGYCYLLGFRWYTHYVTCSHGHTHSYDSGDLYYYKTDVIGQNMYGDQVIEGFREYGTMIGTHSISAQYYGYYKYSYTATYKRYYGYYKYSYISTYKAYYGYYKYSYISSYMRYYGYYRYTYANYRYYYGYYYSGPFSSNYYTYIRSYLYK